MERNEWKLVYAQPNGVLAPLLGGEIEARKILALINAVFKLKQFVPQGELVLNGCVCRECEIDRIGVEIRGVRVHEIST